MKRELSPDNVRALIAMEECLDAAGKTYIHKYYGESAVFDQGVLAPQDPINIGKAMMEMNFRLYWLLVRRVNLSSLHGQRRIGILQYQKQRIHG